MLIEKFRGIKDARSIVKPDQDAAVKTVCLDYMDGIWGGRHTCHPRESGEAGLSSDERSTRSFAHVAKRTGHALSCTLRGPNDAGKAVNPPSRVKCSQSYANA
jgi:hypothetical protein